MIELPAHDSIYEYLLTKIYPENLQDSPLYKIIMNISKYINGLDDKFSFYKLCNGKGINIENKLNTAYIINELNGNRQYIKDTRDIYINIKALTNEIDFTSINVNDVKVFIYNSFPKLYQQMDKFYIDLLPIPQLITQYNEESDPYQWTRELIYKAKDINNIISKHSISIDINTLRKINDFIMTFLVGTPFRTGTRPFSRNK